MLAAKAEVEKQKGKERQGVLLVWPKRPFQGALLQQVGRTEDRMELWVEQLAVPEKVKQRVKAKTRAKEAKARVKARTRCRCSAVPRPGAVLVGGKLERRRWRVEPDRSRLHGQDEVKWSARGESSH